MPSNHKITDDNGDGAEAVELTKLVRATRQGPLCIGICMPNEVVA